MRTVLGSFLTMMLFVAPVLSHQQLYRQRLLQEQLQQHEKEDGPASAAVVTPTSSGGDEMSPKVLDSAVPRSKPVASPPKPSLPPIITHFPPPAPTASNWRLEVTVDGTKQCLILGFVVNMIAVKCLAPEHVVGKFFVCIAVTIGYVLSIYNPTPRFAVPVHSGRDGRSGSSGFSQGGVGLHESMDAAVLGTDVSQCEDPSNCCMHRVLANRVPTGSEGLTGCLRGGEAYGGIPGGRVFKKFRMGSSMTRTSMLESGRSTNVPHSWSTTRGETFAVRSLDYKKTKRKEVGVAFDTSLFAFVLSLCMLNSLAVPSFADLVQPIDLSTSTLRVYRLRLDSDGWKS